MQYLKSRIFLVLFCVIISVISGCSSGSNDYPVSTIQENNSSTSGSSGGIRGVIVDSDSQEPLDGVMVSTGSVNCTTDDNGNYVLNGIPAGTNEIKLKRSSYDPSYERVQVNAGQVTENDFAMSINIDRWLNYSTKYNWQVEVAYSDGTKSQGPVWSFSTETLDAALTAEVTDPIEIDTAQQVAETHMKTDKSLTRLIASKDVITDDNGNNLAYIFNLNPSGYVIVPASKADIFPPVLAYSWKSNISARRVKSLNLVKMIKDDVRLRLAAFNKGVVLSREGFQENRNLWDKYLAGDIDKTATGRTFIDNLIKTDTWEQGRPYNKYCPLTNDRTERCIVGCVATAYAQILNYWQAPKSMIIGAEYSFITKTLGIRVDATEASFQKLNWATDSSEDIAATLSFACGVLGKMDYTTYNSVTGCYLPGKAISSFGYEETKLQRCTRSIFYNKNLIDELGRTDPKGHPVVLHLNKLDYEGDFVSGHTIVCDGYDDRIGSLYHLNLGWGGNSDGWYSLPKNMPPGYNFIWGYIYNIHPSGQKTDKTVRQLFPQNPYPENNETNVDPNESLIWDECDNAVYYNCYLWKDTQNKPATPTFSRLPYGIACPQYLSQ